ncbi:DNA polymerase III subunit gamma/tau [Paenibacillus alkalitolerans]|uniref:DNA polymerase III subunit gamma/tau n=1 Tax=Paenibacillus alkalitolerans TaxID=2799335 RepID=UPI0018F4FC2D|nr:DNA polymerase III subunit gamma/tau [Paenibacillus alkalitolerans]
MARMALYRLWRSQTFEHVVGQRHITQTLQNSLRENRLSHAYLFTGPRGTGKTSTAKILAKAVNCERGPAAEPCNECGACKRITSGACIDVNEFDAASNRGVEEIRDIRDKVKYAPTEVKYKVYIIDEVHMLTTEAFNALLKTLEEPPEHVVFVLATTEPHKVPATIHSRCQRFDFRRISPSEQTAWMRRICEDEGITADEDALALIARLSDGGMRDALSLLDQAVSFTGNSVTYDGVVAMTGGVAIEQYGALAAALSERDVAFVLEFVDRLMREGKSADKCLEGFLTYLRDLLLVKLVPNSTAVNERLSGAEAARLGEVAGRFTHERLFRMVDIVNGYLGEMRYAAQPQTMLEVALLKLCAAEAAGAAVELSAAAAEAVGNQATADLAAELRRLAARVERLEARSATASAAASGSAGASQIAAPAPARPPAAVSRAVSGKTPAALAAFIAAKGSPEYRSVASEWARILSRVKERKITVHAWLVDGEPVSLSDDVVLVAFKNTIHRETTEKPVNKELIESVLAETLGKPYRLATLMLSEWEAASETAAGAASGTAGQTEEFELVSDGEGEEGKSYKEKWINEAIELFGEDIVVVKE